MPEDNLEKGPPPSKPAPPPQAAAAYEAVEQEMITLDKEQLWTINIDIPLAVSIALGVLPGVRQLRPAIERALKEHDLDQFDKLETYALAAWYAYVLSLPAASPSNPVKSLLDEGTRLKRTLMADAEALVARGRLDPDAVAKIRAGQGQVDLANDLVGLYALFTEAWPRIENKTAATPEEINRAGELGPRLLAALGVREHGPAQGSSDAKDRRTRAATLFFRAYNQTRRAAIYLRWDEGDADTIVPSLYKGRGGRKPASKEGQEASKETGKEASKEASKEESAPAAPKPGSDAQPAAPNDD